MNKKNKLGGPILGLAAVLALGHVSMASAASSFDEDFSSGSLPPHLEIVGGVGSPISPGTSCCGGQVGGPVFENGAARFRGRDTRGDNSGGLRSYLRTLDSDYSSVSFVAEVTVTIPPAPGSPNIGRNIVFFGLGPVLPVNTFGDPALSGIRVETLPTNFFPRFRAADGQIGHGDLTCGGNGTHRMRLEWNAQTQIAVASIDQDYTGGTFVADCTLAPFDGSDDGFNATNARIYIGGDWDAVFDDFVVEIAIPTISVGIDIKPGSDPNSINLCSGGAIPIAIFGSAEFDVSLVNTETLRFAEAAVKVVGKKDPRTLCSYEGVNSDGYTDMVCHFVTADIAGIDGESTTATANGELLDGTRIEGSDTINIVKETCN